MRRRREEEKKRSGEKKKRKGDVYIKVQMFEPFQDRNPHFFGTVSLS